jgi:hypothetical protein
VEPTAFLPELEIHRREFRLRYGACGIASARRPVLCLYLFELLTHAEALRSLLLRGLQWCGIQLASAIFFLP